MWNCIASSEAPHASYGTFFKWCEGKRLADPFVQNHRKYVGSGEPSAIDKGGILPNFSAMIIKPLTEAPAPLMTRLLDVLAASLLLTCVFPLMLFVALAIKWESPGPVLRKQPCIG